MPYMIGALRCTGWLLAGIGGVALFALMVLAIAVGVIALGAWTSVMLDLPNSYTGPISFGYMMLGFGIAVGIGLCLEHR